MNLEFNFSCDIFFQTKQQQKEKLMAVKNIEGLQKVVRVHCTKIDLHIYKLYLRDGIKAIAAPQVISNPPTVRRYHFDGILKFKSDESGNTLEYFTNSFL